jgi:dTDP-4-amino-4,6-dideoxygalactose transaminase
LPASACPACSSSSTTFYTFHCPSYTIDPYRRRIGPADSALDFALYIASFPQLRPRGRESERPTGLPPPPAAAAVAAGPGRAAQAAEMSGRRGVAIRYHAAPEPKPGVRRISWHSMQPLPRYRLYTKLRDYGAIAGSVLTGRRLRGDACERLENAIREWGGVPHAVCAPQARLAIHLAVKAIVPLGRKVVLSPYTITDVVNMVISAGATPVFADIERETCNIDPAEIEKLVDADTGAVLITHLHGLACDVPRIVATCRERGVPLIEDAAQAFGAVIGSRRTGTFGDAGIFSFGKYKNVNSFMGGMLVTRHAEVAERARKEMEGWPPHPASHYLREVVHAATTDLATWPPLFKSFTYEVFRFGYLHDIQALNNQVTTDMNPVLRRELPAAYRRRMTPLQARLVLPQLANVDRFIQARIERAVAYDDGLRDVPEVLRPPLRRDGSHMYTYYPIQVEDRAALLRHLMTLRRDVAAQHLKNCADEPIFAEWRRDCPRARATARSVALLPTYPRYSMRDVEQNIRAIRQYFGKA